MCDRLSDLQVMAEQDCGMLGVVVVVVDVGQHLSCDALRDATAKTIALVYLLLPRVTIRRHTSPHSHGANGHPFSLNASHSILSGRTIRSYPGSIQVCHRPRPFRLPPSPLYSLQGQLTHASHSTRLPCFEVRNGCVSLLHMWCM